MNRSNNPKGKKSYTITVYTTLARPYNKYIYVGAKMFYHDDGMFYIVDEKNNLVHQHAMSSIKRIQVDERFEGEWWRKKPAPKKRK